MQVQGSLSGFRACEKRISADDGSGRVLQTGVGDMQAPKEQGRVFRISQVQTPLPDASLESQQWHQRGQLATALVARTLSGSKDRGEIILSCFAFGGKMSKEGKMQQGKSARDPKMDTGQIIRR